MISISRKTKRRRCPGNDLSCHRRSILHPHLCILHLPFSRCCRTGIFCLSSDGCIRSSRIESHDIVPRHSLRYEPLGREGVNVGAAEVATPPHPGRRQILIPISVKYGERDDYRVGRRHPNSEEKFGISYEKAKLFVSAQVC